MLFGFDEERTRRVVNVVRRVEADPRVGAGTLPTTVSSGQSQLWLPCRNTSGSTIPAFSVVRVDAGSTIDDIYQPTILQPDSTFRRIYGVTGPFDCVTGDTIGVTFETALVKVDSGTPLIGETYGPKDGQFTLSKSQPGFIVVELFDSSRSLVWARPQVPTGLIGKPTADIAGISGSTPTGGNVAVYSFDGTTLTASGLTVTAYNLGVDLVTSGRWVQLKFVQGYWWIDFEGCES